MSEGIIAVTLLAWLAYLGSRVVRQRGLPEIVAFLAVGALLGPSGIEVISEENLRGLAPVTDLALAVLMFVIGERLSRRALEAAPWALWSGLAQYVVSGTLVYVVARWVGADDAVALLLAVLAGAGAPMTVASVTASVRSQGPYARGLIGAHAVADALAALAFAGALPVAEVLSRPNADVVDAAAPFLQRGAGGALLGAAMGWVVARLGSQIETSGELLLFALVHVLVGAVVAAGLGVSLPLVALTMGAVAASLATPAAGQRMFVAVRSIEQPLYLVFFGLAGASMHLDALPELGLLGIGYVAARVLGKLIGAVIGSTTGGLGVRQGARLGLDLVPQAGVAVGLAVRGAEALPAAGGDAATVVLGSVVLFELVGPLLVSRSLRSEEEPSSREAPAVPEQAPLPGRVLVASPGPLDVPAWVFDLCARSGSELWFLSGRSEDEPHIDALRGQAAAENLPFHWMADDGDSFAGTVITAAEDIGADIVAVAGSRGRGGRTSRFVVHPHEHIARELSCPVIVLGPAAPVWSLRASR